MRWRLTSLLAAAIIAGMVAAGATVTAAKLGQPPKVSGVRTAAGIRVISREPENPFTLEIAARQFRPIASDRLAWVVDGSELELATERRRRRSTLLVPLSDIDELRALRQLHVESLTPAGWQLKVEEEFEFPSGAKCLFWLLNRNRDIRLQAATLNGEYLIILALSASNASAARELALTQYVRQTLLSLKHEGGAALQASEPNPHQTGTPLQTQLKFEEENLKVPHGILLNAALMTNADLKASRVIPVTPVTLVELARLRLEIPDDEPKMMKVNGVPRPVYSMKRLLPKLHQQAGVPGPVFDPDAHFLVSVFDGEAGHVVRLLRFNEADGTFRYWDPWPRGSFLAAASNKAGVSAKPYPSEEQTWTVTEDELVKVLYAMVMPMDEVFSLFRLCSALSGPSDEALSTYRELHSAYPASDETSKEHLNTMAAFLLERKQAEQAAAMYRAEFAIYPPSAEAKAEVAARLQAAGLADAEKALDRPAELPPAIRAQGLDRALESEFFKHFVLKQVDSGTQQELGRAVFRPSGPAFHDVVELRAALNLDQTVNAWGLALARDFVNDGDTGRFATDVAASFLRFAIETKPGDSVDRLAREIRAGKRSLRPVPVLLARHPDTILPTFPSSGEGVYLGAGSPYEQTLTGGILRLENTESGGAQYLRISVTAKP